MREFEKFEGNSEGKEGTGGIGEDDLGCVYCKARPLDSGFYSTCD